jgi:hypothetical protein
LSRRRRSTATPTSVRWRERLLAGFFPCKRKRQELAGQRPSSLNTRGWIVEGRRTTPSGIADRTIP